jgi:hypothetical protein
VPNLKRRKRSRTTQQNEGAQMSSELESDGAMVANLELLELLEPMVLVP